jgi:hypothetical protein
LLQLLLLGTEIGGPEVGEREFFVLRGRMVGWLAVVLHERDNVAARWQMDDSA